MNTYRWNAQDYVQNSQAQQQWAKELIAQLQLSGHENVLDLGCGDGKVTAEIAKIVDRGAVVAAADRLGLFLVGFDGDGENGA